MTELEQILDNFGERVTRLAKINIGRTVTINGKRRKIDNTGKLRESIGYETEVNPNSFALSIEMEEYGVNVDRGRKPGKGIPVDVLKEWIRQKPIRLRDLKTGEFKPKTKSSEDQLSFLINRKIREKGIEATNFMTEPFEAEFKKLPDEVVEAYGLDVEELLNQTLRNGVSG